jgi:hypothetical protein
MQCQRMEVMRNSDMLALYTELDFVMGRTILQIALKWTL